MKHLEKGLQKKHYVVNKEIGGKVIIVTLTAAMLLGSMTGCGSSKKEEAEDDESTSVSQAGEFDETSEETKKKTKQIEKIIDKYFYFEEDSEKREESYYDGIMRGLDDPYSVYYTPEEYEKLKEDDSGSFEGIGATLSKDMDKGTVYVVRPLPNTPAERAGLLPDDIIVKVDDLELTTDMELDTVVKHVRGEKGTDVVLTIYREGEPDFLEITITRDTIENTTVISEMLDNNIGYIQIEQFIENTNDLFFAAVDDLQNQGAKGLIIDLRNNPGGLVKQTTEMVDYIVKDDAKVDNGLDAGVMLETRDKDGKVMESYECKDGHSVDLPIVILVNGNSASSSEIFTGCLKDYGIAKVVGTKSYGKGIVQSIIPLSDGSAVKITIAKYFLPSGENIHEEGIEPDVEEELDESQLRKVTIPHEDDNQLQKAIEVLDLD